MLILLASSDERRALAKILPPGSALVPNPLKSFLLHEKGSPNEWSSSIEITACVVADEQDLVHLDEFSANWDGPISLLILTKHMPASPNYNALARRISTLNAYDLGSFLTVFGSSNSTKAQQRKHRRNSAHLLYHQFSRALTPSLNSLLNLARMHASTSMVLLFPRTLTDLPIRGLHKKLVDAKLGSQPLIIPRVAFENLTTNSLFSATSYPSGTVSFVERAGQDGAALLLMKDATFWCTEQFFSFRPLSVLPRDHMDGSGRTSVQDEWAECLWHVLLEYPSSVQLGSESQRLGSSEYWKGALITWGVSGSTHLTQKNLDEKRSDIHVSVSCFCLNSDRRLAELWGSQTRIHRRIAAQFRAETCMLVARQRSAQGLWDSTDRQNRPQGPNVEQVWETEASAKHTRQICDTVCAICHPKCDQSHLSILRRLSNFGVAICSTNET